jgi:hypothetical protein
MIFFDKKFQLRSSVPWYDLFLKLNVKQTNLKIFCNLKIDKPYIAFLPMYDILERYQDVIQNVSSTFVLHNVFRGFKTSVLKLLALPTLPVPPPPPLLENYNWNLTFCAPPRAARVTLLPQIEKGCLLKITQLFYASM